MTIIPPKSVVRLIRKDAGMDEGLTLGQTFRIGYYGKQDGLSVVWLVDAQGTYEQTWDQDTLPDYFEVISLSDENDLYGEDRPKL